MKLHRYVFLPFLITGLLFSGAALAQDLGQNILVSHAWVRAMPPSVKNTAAYMTIENQTGVELILQSASTTAARIVELHKMEHAGNMMKMQQVDALLIPSGGVLALEPKSFHLMIIGLLKPLAEGATIPIVLNFAGGSNVTVNAVVHK